MSDFTHLDDKGHVKMVDVTGKEKTNRTAVAQGIILMNAKTLDKITSQTVNKGNVLETARIAGIMAAKKTSDLIPMCHPLNITNAKIDFFPDEKNNSILIKSEVSLFDRTGVEMEALTAVSVSALTIYDMCKSYDKGMKITDICLLKKTGGKSGEYIR
ncbi:MAG: cyclic pyranopterin monophosphate synthase MoaC [Desulfobacteraceae bacterium]|jgi:cyclic pyranopterin monophosphate synthase|nr:cyclic pyranopterin monophosphate synthase MoaC [Desulfobacteraceae bacterium]